MRATKRSAAALVLWAILLFGQTGTPRLAFDVASIRPSTGPTMAAAQAGKAHVGMTIDPGRVDIGYLSLTALIHYAFQIPKRRQLIGPDWMNGEHFDIAAKLPENTKREQIPAMLQALLIERFGMQLHRERREIPVYALTFADSGFKL